jgi:mono/diheme cytochrome c family protein
MKRFFKITGALIGVICVLAGSFAGYLHLSGIPHYTPPSIKASITVTPERVARGKRLASVLCSECHLNDQRTALTGKLLRDIPPSFGLAHSANITQDPEYGIGKWSDGDILGFLRTGIRPSGNYAPPYMPKFPLMSDEDISSIIAFLHSSESIVQAQAVNTVASTPSLFTKFLCFVAIKPLPYPKAAITEPDTTQLVEYGKYLVQGRFACFGCHSGDLAKIDELSPEKSFNYLGGGAPLTDTEGRVISSRNITFDETNGIGKWSLDEFKLALRTGIVPHKQPALRYPMMPYAPLTDNEVEAIYTYLKSAPKQAGEIKRVFYDN